MQSGKTGFDQIVGLEGSHRKLQRSRKTQEEKQRWKLEILDENFKQQVPTHKMPDQRIVGNSPHPASSLSIVTISCFNLLVDAFVCKEESTLLRFVLG